MAVLGYQPQTKGEGVAPHKDQRSGVIPRRSKVYIVKRCTTPEQVAEKIKQYQRELGFKTQQLSGYA